MVKFTSIVIVISLLLIFTAIVIDGEAQNETRSRNRSKLSSAVRKKKTSLGKVKVAEVTTLPPTMLDETVVGSTTPDASNTIPQTEVIADVEAEPVVVAEVTTTAQPPKVARNVSPRVQNNPPARTGPVPEGCGECDQDECNTPADSSCPTGLVLDRCSCCYICGALEGNRCYNSTFKLPYNPDVGICGPHLDCLLRSDLDPTEPREALCECRDRRIVCGSDQQTYLSECKLREAAHSKGGLVARTYSPCVAAPVMTTPVENATVPIGEDISMSCEVRGFPAPILHWEFQAEGSRKPPQILPGDDSGIVVVVRGGPEQIMTTSWIQIIAVDPKRQGTYFCVAKNTEGMVQAGAEVRVYKSFDGDDEF